MNKNTKRSKRREGRKKRRTEDKWSLRDWNHRGKRNWIIRIPVWTRTYTLSTHTHLYIYIYMYVFISNSFYRCSLLDRKAFFGLFGTKCAKHKLAHRLWTYFIVDYVLTEWKPRTSCLTLRCIESYVSQDVRHLSTVQTCN